MKLESFAEAFSKPGSRNIRLALSLLFITIATVLVMIIFSVAKVFLDPGITVWETHTYTILFTGIIAPLIALFVLLRFEGLYEKVTEENEERKRTEEALRESEEKYRSIVETATEGIWMSDTDGRTTFVNKRMAEMIGYSPEEMFGKLAYDFMDEEARVIARQNLERRRQGLRDSFEQKYIRKDGMILWAIVSATSLRDKDGQVIAFMGILADITDRKYAEKELRKSVEVARRRAEELEKLMDMVPAAIWVSEDPECRTITGNMVANRFYEAEVGENVSAGPACGGEQDTTRRFFKDGRELRPEELPMQEAVARGVDVSASELDVLLPSGKWRVLLGNASPLLDDRGRVRGGLGVYMDITDRKQAEEELKAAKAQAELYVDLMGHDINNLNQSAMGYLEMALQALETEKQLRLDDKVLIERPIHTLADSSALIDNVRKLQILMTEGVKAKPTDLQKIFREVETTSFHLDDRDVLINIQHVPGIMVEANELLKDVFVNLIANAVKHSAEEKPLTVNVKVEAVNENGQKYYRCMVEDNGPGIPDELKSKLFHRFHRGTTKAHGKGLGLYLVKTLVEGYHGRVWVEDRVQGDHTEGVRFVVMLPAIEK